MFDRAIPVLASLEIGTSLDYFHKLGFETHDFGDSNYGIAIREHIEIHFWLCTDRHVAENTSCYVRVNDIHALHADFVKRMAVRGVVESPWGMDELYVYDSVCTLLKFGQVTDRFIQADAVQEAPVRLNGLHVILAGSRVAAGSRNESRLPPLAGARLVLHSRIQ